MKVNDTDRKTGFWWVVALSMLLAAFMWAHYDNSTVKHNPPVQNVHATPTPNVSHHAR